MQKLGKIRWNYSVTPEWRHLSNLLQIFLTQVNFSWWLFLHTHAYNIAGPSEYWQIIIIRLQLVSIFFIFNLMQWNSSIVILYYHFFGPQFLDFKVGLACKNRVGVVKPDLCSLISLGFCPGTFLCFFCFLALHQATLWPAENQQFIPEKYTCDSLNLSLFVTEQWFVKHPSRPSKKLKVNCCHHFASQKHIVPCHLLNLS